MNVGATVVPGWPQGFSLIEARPRVGIDQLSALFLPSAGNADPTAQVIVCDAAVQDIEAGQPIPGVSAGHQRMLLSKGMVVYNVDHHAVDPRNERWISSAVLALEYYCARAGGLVPHPDHVVINHSDCDSITSAALCAGVLASPLVTPAMAEEALAWYRNWSPGLVPDLPRKATPAHRIIRAVICADHSGQADPIADCLQGLDHDRDPAHSLQTLIALLCDQPLSPRARSSIDEREKSRTTLVELVREKGRWFEDIFVLNLGPEGRHIDNALLPPLVPEAAFTMLWFPSYLPGHSIVKLRLGSSAPSGARINLLPWDASYGGRWNAGGNSRAGGTTLRLEAWLEEFFRWRKTY